MRNVTIYTKGNSDLIDLQKRDEMVSRTGRTTVPQIFFDEQNIGGRDDLLNYFSNRKVVKRLFFALYK